MKCNKLLYKFKKISLKGWIEGMNQNALNNVGITFEKLLGKKPDSMFFPDIEDIEIKCSQRYSRYPLSLFSLAFDGPYLYETNRILQKYGIPDHKYRNNKKIYAELYLNKKTLVNYKYQFELKINKKEEKLYLYVYDEYNNLLNKEAYIEFETIKNRLILKLSKLAMVYASKKEINNIKYFRYYEITIYELKSFDTFIELLEKEIIFISYICRTSRSGPEEGRQRNKNLVFQIKKENLLLLFNQIKRYNTDEKKSY